MKNKIYTEETSITVFKTNDYDKFKFLKGNRQIHVESNITTKLLSSTLLTKGNVAPILINSNFEIIDGQHRLYVCKMSKQPVQYIIISPEKQAALHSEDLMITLNETANKWKLPDYMHKSATFDGKKEYQTMIDLATKYNVDINTVANLFGVSANSLYNNKDIELQSNQILVSGMESFVKIRNTFVEILGSKPRPQILAIAIKKYIKLYNNLNINQICDGMKNTLVEKPADNTQTYLDILITARNFNKQQATATV